MKLLFLSTYLVSLLFELQLPSSFDLFHQHCMQYHRSAYINDTIKFRLFDTTQRSCMIVYGHSPVPTTSHFHFRASCCVVFSSIYSSITTNECLFVQHNVSLNTSLDRSNAFGCSYQSTRITWEGEKKSLDLWCCRLNFLSHNGAWGRSRG
jgi:hypothetical protein